MWQHQGLGVSSGYSALSALHVDINASNNTMRKSVHRLFNDLPVSANPPGTRIPQRCCHERLFGLCETQHAELVERIRTAVYNIYVTLKRWRITRQDFPILIDTYCDGGDVLTFFLTDSIGKGDVQLLMELENFVVGAARLCKPRLDERSVVMPSVSHMTLLRMLYQTSGVRHMPAKDIDTLHLCQIAFSRYDGDGGGDSFVVERGVEKRRRAVSFAERLGAPRRVAPLLPFGLVKVAGQDNWEEKIEV